MKREGKSHQVSVVTAAGPPARLTASMTAARGTTVVGADRTRAREMLQRSPRAAGREE